MRKEGPSGFSWKIKNIKNIKSRMNGLPILSFKKLKPEWMELIQISLLNLLIKINYLKKLKS